MSVTDPTMLSEASERQRRSYSISMQTAQAGLQRQPQLSGRQVNVGSGERQVSLASGSVLALLGLARRDLRGLFIAAVGGGMVYRGATGHCSVYSTLGMNTAEPPDQQKGQPDYYTSVSESLLIDKPPEELYRYWRNFENLPRIMTHLESVRVVDDRRSHWGAQAPTMVGGRVEWDAEIVADEPGSRIAWNSLPGSSVETRGWVRFVPALGDRGTAVRVFMEYHPPAGPIGRWFVSFFNKVLEKQIRDDLRNLKRLMEMGEILILGGQPRGSCLGQGSRHGDGSD